MSNRRLLTVFAFVIVACLAQNRPCPVAEAHADIPRTETSSNRRATATAKNDLDMAELESRFASHQGPTMLYMNFDGWVKSDDKGHTIIPFAGNTNDRDRDIQEILYRTSEMFAPFNLQVVRLKGQGRFDHGKAGNTTIFVGASTANISAAGLKFTSAVTPGQYTDFPHAGAKTPREPNSMPYHIAYVDPIGQRDPSSGWYSHDSNVSISRHAAHEAGHTFGLAHVLSDSYPELMSYDANIKTRFVNQTYPTTDLNWNPKTSAKEPQPKSTLLGTERRSQAKTPFNVSRTFLGPGLLTIIPMSRIRVV